MTDYAEEIIDHYKSPRNFAEMTDANLSINESNSSCGDVVQIQLKVEGGKIQEMKWRGVGCAISTAAASTLSEKVVGMEYAEIEKINEEGIVQMLGGEINLGRMKCATLAYRALLKAIYKK